MRFNTETDGIYLTEGMIASGIDIGEMYICARCNGTGYLDEGECGSCEGCGEICWKPFCDNYIAVPGKYAKMGIVEWNKFLRGQIEMIDKILDAALNKLN